MVHSMEVDHQVFNLVIFMLSRLRRRKRKKLDFKVSGVAQVEGKAGDTGSLTVTLWKYITVLLDFLMF